MTMTKEIHMAVARTEERFFATTRGRIATLLRRGNSTVDELATALGITGNAVRAQLATLERDGLVQPSEMRSTGGRPSYAYGLTSDGERLFPKAYDVLLHELLAVLDDQVEPETLESALREVGHRLAQGQPAPNGDLRQRVERGIAYLNRIGGLAEMDESDEGLAIRSCSCPLAAAVKGSPDACVLAETLLSDLIGAPVRQVCDQGPPPRCHFEVAPSRT